MRTGVSFVIVFGLVASATLACGPTAREQPNNGNRSDAGGQVDASDMLVRDANRPDAPNSVYEDASMSVGDGGMCGADWICPNPVDLGCNPGGGEICNDGLDNDCDGQVDEFCTCVQGSVQPCFRGPPGKRDVGACQDGMQTCTGSGEFTSWGECVGGISPGSEVCDSLDNSCNGCVDDHPDCCVVDLDCPGPRRFARWRAV